MTNHPSKAKDSPFGWTHPDRDAREMCPHCKNEDTHRVRDIRLDQVKAHHGAEAVACECWACGAFFHFRNELRRESIGAQPPKSHQAELEEARNEAKRWRDIANNCKWPKPKLPWE